MGWKNGFVFVIGWENEEWDIGGHPVGIYGVSKGLSWLLICGGNGFGGDSGDGLGYGVEEWVCVCNRKRKWRVAYR